MTLRTNCQRKQGQQATYWQDLLLEMKMELRIQFIDKLYNKPFYFNLLNVNKKKEIVFPNNPTATTINT